MRKFMLDAADTFAVAAGLVVITDYESLLAVGSWEQFMVVGLALGRSAAIAGVIAVAPKIRARLEARRESKEG